jgi:hypothetical protein
MLDARNFRLKAQVESIERGFPHGRPPRRVLEDVGLPEIVAIEPASRQRLSAQTLHLANRLIAKLRAIRSFQARRGLRPSP